MMFFQNKPLIYLQLYNQSLRYMAVHSKNHTVLSMMKFSLNPI